MSRVSIIKVKRLVLLVEPGVFVLLSISFSGLKIPDAHINEIEDIAFVFCWQAGNIGSMNGYLIFKNDRTVELVPITYFVENGKSSKLFLKESNNNALLNAWDDSVKGNYGNIVEVSDILSIEKQRNAENRSKVKVKYSRD